MGCQKEIVNEIVMKGGDYIIALKKNQGGLYNRVVDLFKQNQQQQGENTLSSGNCISESNHGREETRQLHWVLDVQFHEDDSRIRKDNSPENLAIVRHIALNLLNQEKTLKVGTKAKRNRAGWDNDYLLKVLIR
jgi:predicted transposase YbfD/YdcC